MVILRRFAALLSCSAVLCYAGCGHGSNSGHTGAQSAGDAVATVNGEPITRAEFDTQMENYTPDPRNPVAVPTGRAVLERLISNLLVEQLAAQQKVAPTQAEIDDEFDNLAFQTSLTNVKTLEDQLDAVGVSDDEYKQSTIKPLLSQLKLLTKGITVSDADVQNYYDQNKEKTFDQPARAHIKRIVLATKAQADAVYQQIKSGSKMFEDFLPESVMHDSPTGDISSWVPLDAKHAGDLQILINAVNGVKTGETALPFLFKGAYWIVKLVEKRPAELVPLAKAKSSITFALLEQKAQSNPATFVAVKQQVREFQIKSKIQIPEARYADFLQELQHPLPDAPQPTAAPPTFHVVPQASQKAHP